MTRFDADTPAERRKLFAAAIAAHRERGSPFATFEVHESTDGTATDDPDRPAPWIQFGDGTVADRDEDGGTRGADRSGAVLNLDCTEAELDRLEALLHEFPAFRIEDLVRPEEAEGVNVRVSALADPNRTAEFVDRAFREVYGRGEDYRAWVAAV